MQTRFICHSERFSLYNVIRIVLLQNVILNAVKNLSERIDVGAIVDGRAIPEILRSAQDDIHISIKESVIRCYSLQRHSERSEESLGKC
mgnify:CR=1 FL=1